jgi:sodium-dependent dicarboxylate transporter 2/3/5
MDRESVSRLGLIIGPILFAIILSLPSDMSFQAKAVLAITAWMATWWVTEAIPIYGTALLPLILFPLFNVATLQQLAGSYADRIIFLFLGGFILAAAIERSGLHERIALRTIRTFGTSPRSIVAGFMITTAFISAWISNTATAIMMLPIAASIITQVKENERKRFGTCLMLCVAYSASIGGMATLVGTPPNAIFASLSKSLADVDISFGQFMLVGVPISAVSLAFIGWYMVNFGARISREPIVEGKVILLERLKILGSLTRKEKIVAAVFASTAAAWISRGLVWGDLVPMVDDSVIAIFAAVTLFILPAGKERVMDWGSAMKIPWGVLLLMGGGLALASGFTLTGLDKWIAEQFVTMGVANIVSVIASLVGVTIFSGEIMSNTAGAALIIPVAASIAEPLSINPIMLMLPVALATSFDFILPTGTPPNAIVFGSGYVTVRQMARAGIALDFFGIVIVTLLSLLLAPAVFGT